MYSSHPYYISCQQREGGDYFPQKLRSGTWFFTSCHARLIWKNRQWPFKHWSEWQKRVWHYIHYYKYYKHAPRYMRIYTIQHDTLAHVLQFSNITIFDVFPLCHICSPILMDLFNTSQGIMQNCWLNMICIANFIQPKSHFHFSFTRVNQASPWITHSSTS